ncbi:Glutamine amidotransferase of anthranilate synthase or aminodeoxychorismate synthase [Planctomycetales bacterium 10988]|nr:Glutamine amidotransferase of anthranilate synthase or aminodeoxychorismate synthase [Planctomycetales bacterium 10988]
MLLLIDHFDSFVHNLSRYFQLLGQETLVVRSDNVSIEAIQDWNPAAIVLSPGPCTPGDAPESLEIVRQLGSKLPMLGVCLGHQIMAEALGGNVVRAKQPYHGRASEIQHDGLGVFQGLPETFAVGRYHSLIVAEHELTSEWVVSARTVEEGTVMALRHRAWPLVGLQFHPESILTEHGLELLANFLRTIDGTWNHPLDTYNSELPLPQAAPFYRPLTPVPYTVRSNR